jgi:Big-like domain-containing protein/putative Ig domain-containing protein
MALALEAPKGGSMRTLLPGFRPLAWIVLSIVAGASPAWAQDAPPVITGPATILAQEGVFFSVTFGATSVDPSRTVVMTGPAPSCGISFSSFPGIGQTTGTLRGTPSYDCAGTYVVTITANDGVSSTSMLVSLTIANTDRAPVVTAPTFQTVGENHTLIFTVSATDPDGDAIASLTAAGTAITAGGTFTANAARTSGTFSWTTSFTSAGAYSVTFTAANALSGTATTSINVCDICGDASPVVTAPILVTGRQNTLITFQVQAIDPDGQAVTSLTAFSNPPTPGSVFTVNATNTSGTFSWTPTFTQSGNVFVTFTASNTLSGTATTQIDICDGCDRPPVVTAPASVGASLNVPMSILVLANDPDGQAITSLTASGSPMTMGATFTTNVASFSGTFSWTPPATLPHGIYLVTFTASNALSGAATTQITVGGDRAPVVNAPALVPARQGSLLTFTVLAFDPDGDAITSLTSSSSPATTGSTFTANAQHTSGTFSWTPSFTQDGTYTVTFTASNALSGMASTVITIGGDRAPVVTAPATVSSPDFSPITFTVTAVEPDGDGIVSLTAAGSAITAGGTFIVSADHTSGTFSWSPTTTQAGVYSVTFTATDGFAGLQGSATTQISVGQNTPARAFTTNSYKTITGKPQWCVHVEPVSGSFQITDIQLGSVVLRSAGTGSVSEIPAITGKTNVQGDVDNNGIDDAEFCFTKGNLQLLFSNLNGRWAVPVTIAGRLMSGLFFEAPLAIYVIAGGGGSMAAVAPNPLNPSGTLSFGTGHSGMVRVRLFDGQGRLVRTVLDTALPAGPHIVPLDARDAAGSPLASGVYFYRVEAPGDVMSGRFVVAK